jgi:hypothetical protein
MQKVQRNGRAIPRQTSVTSGNPILQERTHGHQSEVAFCQNSPDLARAVDHSQEHSQDTLTMDSRVLAGS